MDTNHFKKLLETELTKVEGELKSIGRRNPNNPNDWEATPKAFQADSADRMEVADAIDDYEDNTAILKDLEIRYNEIKSALERISAGTYGICGVCKQAIDPKRLEANPAASSCVAHAK